MHPNLICSAAVRTGNIEVVKWLYFKGWFPAAYAHTLGIIAAETGNVLVLQFLHERGLKLSWRMSNAAALNDHRHMLIWLRTKGEDWTVQRVDPSAQKSVLSCAAGTGQLPLTQWLVASGCSLEATAFYQAAAGGHIDVLEWMRDEGLHVSGATMCEHAAVAGRINVLQWALKNIDRKLHPKTPGFAAWGGHVDVVKWAFDMGCPLSSMVTEGIATHGDLEALKWARHHGCAWDQYTCAGAARKGHIAVLKWAIANGCPWSSTTCLHLVQNKAWDALKWAIHNGCPWHPSAYRAMELHGVPNMFSWESGDGAK